jgi:hypothetical protein
MARKYDVATNFVFLQLIEKEQEYTRIWQTSPRLW